MNLFLAEWKEFERCIGVSDPTSSMIRDLVISLEVISRILLCLGDCLSLTKEKLLELLLDAFLGSLLSLGLEEADFIGL